MPVLSPRLGSNSPVPNPLSGTDMPPSVLVLVDVSALGVLADVSTLGVCVDVSTLDVFEEVVVSTLGVCVAV